MTNRKRVAVNRLIGNPDPIVLKRGITARWFFAVGLILLNTSSAVAIATGNHDKVTIEGGPDPDYGYTWTVTNQHASPIVELRFPHHMADLFFTPDGWSQDCENLVNVGVPRPWGECTATADSDRDGIATGTSGRFRMRIAPADSQKGTGSVNVRWADGTTERVHGVTVPVRPTAWQEYTGLMGLAVVLVLIAVIKALKRPRQDGAPTVAREPEKPAR